jgi:hypothetical protein
MANFPLASNKNNCIFNNMKIGDCPYLDSIMELTEEREKHIISNHPDLLPDHENQMAEASKDPEEVRRNKKFFNARMFCRWFDSIRAGRYVVVVVISEAETLNRHWIITAYLSRKITHGENEWKKD